ncbi:MAG: c-type cytochrome [Gammaproteobacteria bacterium]|nr:c-type cytochrome [Gammaproteobacteria bacterium]
MKKVVLCILSLTLVLSPGIICAAEPVTSQPTPERFIYCTVCHGTAFQGNRSLDAPNLSILGTWYVKVQLMNYKKMIRGGAGAKNHVQEMQQMVTALDEDAIGEVSAFVGTMKSTPASSTIFGDSARGAKLYQSCGTCHGADGLGNETFGAPRLAGQHDWYLERELVSYRNGSRGAAEGDLYGAQMRASISMLEDEESIRDVLVYINTFNQTLNKN